MKKFICILAVLSILISCFNINCFAFGDNSDVISPPYAFVNNPNCKSSDIENFIVLTKHASGEITSESKDFSNNSVNQFSVNNNFVNVLKPYIPENPSYQYSVTSVNSTTDSYGRTPIFDSRAGLIASGFDTDEDGIADEWTYGTGSLQHYDIVISCAHILWSPLYKDLDCEGWATELYYLGGVNGDKYTPLAYSSYSSISISQAYVNDSYVAPAPGGTYSIIGPFGYDWSIIQVADNIGGQLGWFGLHGCGTPETGVSIYTVGYPYDKGNYQSCSTGTLLSFNDNIVYHDAVTIYGDSGAPMLNNGYVYGVITGQEMSGQFTGVRMFDELFGMIVESRNESEERWG